ncbi:MAG TPA: hypothetical protein VK766_09110 [Cytophagaceae bacterium]|jgi:hypothetical protein|nr:hypothetical protein [Cytophagaceae bacterium]
MKTSRKLSMILLGIVFTFQYVVAQVPGNYKAPKIDEGGKVTNSNGDHIGWVTKDGVIKDTKGNKVAALDSEGNLVDAATGKKMGKAEKNGNYSSYGTTTPDKGWKLGDAQNGMCHVKDEKGNVVGQVHENYKAQGACAIHCLTNQPKKK